MEIFFIRKMEGSYKMIFKAYFTKRIELAGYKMRLLTIYRSLS